MAAKKIWLRVVLWSLVLLLARPAAARAVDHLDADFENPVITYTPYTVADDFVPGRPVPVAANRSDRPSRVDIAGAVTVAGGEIEPRTGLSHGNFLRLADRSGDFNGAEFNLCDQPFSRGCVRVAWDALFETRDNYRFSLLPGNQPDLPSPPVSNPATGPDAEPPATIVATTAGELIFTSAGNRVHSVSYEADSRLHFECFFDLDNHRWAAVLNGEVLFTAAEAGISSLGAFLAGCGADPDENGAMQLDNLKMRGCEPDNWPSAEAPCQAGLPAPRLFLRGTRNGYTTRQYVTINLAVANWRAFPDSLFTPSPELPPCGLNHNAARTWIDVVDQNEAVRYGFCALKKPAEMNHLWFSVSNLAAFPKSLPESVKIVLKDRLCDNHLQSNEVALRPEMFATVSLRVSGPGNIRSSDGFVCSPEQLDGEQVYTLIYLKGQRVVFHPIPRDGDGYRASFIGWNLPGCGTGDLSLTITDNLDLEARFGAVDDIPTTMRLPVPKSPHQPFSYPPAAMPAYNPDPAACRPFAVGTPADGTIDLKFGLPWFNGLVDVYLAISLPVNDGAIMLFVPGPDGGYSLQPLSCGLTPWKERVTYVGTQNFFGPISLDRLPAGDYYLWTLVTPAGNRPMTGYYLWSTGFTVE